MPRDDLPILNLSNPRHKRVLKGYIDGLKGLHRFEVIRVRDQRSLAQNAYMHGVVFPLVARGLSAVWGYSVSMLEAKEDMKDRFLRCDRVNKETGEVLGQYTPSTADLDKEECGRFIERIKDFAATELSVHIPDPNEYENEGAAQEASDERRSAGRNGQASRTPAACG